MKMTKQSLLEVFEKSHKNFYELINVLTSHQLTEVNVLEHWTVKDVIAHLSAWNWEQAVEIDNILKNNPTWNKKYRTKKDEDDFNNKAVEERKEQSLSIIIHEWEKSFKALIKRIEKLTKEEWSNKYMKRLFKYEENGLSDEGQHARQIKNFFKMK